MRQLMAVLASAMLLAPSLAGASPPAGAGASSLATDPTVLPVHHKPGHRGGPPWARRGSDRDDWRDRREPAYTQVCRTEYRTRFDPYVGDYVREPVRTCREGYGYE